MSVQETRRGADVLSIRELCEDYGVTARALRFYEARGLIAPTRYRSRRLYSAADAERLQLILKLKALGLSILEIQQVLARPTNGPYGLSRRLHMDLIERMKAQKFEAESALEQLQNIGIHFAPRP